MAAITKPGILEAHQHTIYIPRLNKAPLYDYLMMIIGHKNTANPSAYDQNVVLGIEMYMDVL